MNSASDQMTSTRLAIIMAITEEGGVGPKMFQHLLLHLGPPEELQNVTAAELEELPRMNPERVTRVLNSLERTPYYMGKIDEYKADSISISCILDDDYPGSLRVIGDPPPIIYFKGDFDKLNGNLIAMVGTTKATQAGLRLTVDIAREMARRGFGVVSGLATGIDSAAHLGALKEHGVTIAVLGSGIMEIYPEENRPLAGLVEKSGLLISDQPPFQPVSKSGLVLRNRIISALAKAVIVVQVADDTRGELHTAAYAHKQAKPLFYGDPDGDFDYERVREWPGSIINSVDAVDEMLDYVIPD